LRKDFFKKSLAKSSRREILDVNGMDNGAGRAD